MKHNDGVLFIVFCFLAHAQQLASDMEIEATPGTT
jgi:hypothetical protein